MRGSSSIYIVDDGLLLIYHPNLFNGSIERSSKAMGGQIQVNPEMLYWARKTAGFGIDDVVAKLRRKKITAETIRRWEAGDEGPTYAQLEQLAYKIYRRPLALFFFPEPPEEKTAGETFRTLPQAEIKRMSPRFLYLVRQARAMQENLKELFDGTNPALKRIFTDIEIGGPDTISSVAKVVRQYFGVGFDKPGTLKTSDDALTFWCNVVEQHGIFVFKDAFRDAGYSGFCLYDEEFPVIYINNRRSGTQQIFTLFHELAHILFKTGGIDPHPDDFIRDIAEEYRGIEVFCNRFAGEFLVPTEDIKPHVVDRELTDELLVKLAKKYSVSREVVLRKCHDLKLASDSFYQSKVEAWGKPSKGATSGGHYYNHQGVGLGSFYIEAAFRKFYEGGLSNSRLAEFLGIKESSVSQFLNHMLSQEVTEVLRDLSAQPEV